MGLAKRELPTEGHMGTFAAQAAVGGWAGVVRGRGLGSVMRVTVLSQLREAAMITAPQSFNSGVGVWHRRADSPGTEYHHLDKAFEDADRAYDGSDDYRACLAAEPPGSVSAIHQPVAKATSARVLRIESAIELRGGVLDPSFSTVEIFGPEERIVPRRPMPASSQRSNTSPDGSPRTARRTDSGVALAGFRP